MPSIAKDIATLRDPANIKDAFYASSPYVLRKAFERDATVQRLLRAGRRVAPLVVKELARSRGLPEISRACFAYILDKIAPDMADQALPSLLRAAARKPGPFFVHFAAHSLRSTHRLPVKPQELVYSRSEIDEVMERIH